MCLPVFDFVKCDACFLIDKPHETNIDTTTNGEPEPELKREIIQPQTASPTGM